METLVKDLKAGDATAMGTVENVVRESGNEISVRFTNGRKFRTGELARVIVWKD